MDFGVNENLTKKEMKFTTKIQINIGANKNMTKREMKFTTKIQMEKLLISDLNAKTPNKNYIQKNK